MLHHAVPCVSSSSRTSLHFRRRATCCSERSEGPALVLNKQVLRCAQDDNYSLTTDNYSPTNDNYSLTNDNYRMGQKSRVTSTLKLQRPFRSPRATWNRMRSKNGCTATPTDG